MAREDFELTATVLVEVEWVLRSFYRWPGERRAAALRLLLDLPHAVVLPRGVDWAVARLAQGADFADMMHLMSVSAAQCFATFDRELEKGAGGDAPVRVETLA